MNANLAAILYLVAGVLFILSLRGLSSPATSRQGNLFGMIGMAIAVATTLAVHPPADGIAWVLVILDDLQWLDRASAGVLSFVARRLAGSQVALIGASRSGEVQFFDHGGIPELEVLRRDDGASAQLLDTLDQAVG